MGHVSRSREEVKYERGEAAKLSATCHKRKALTTMNEYSKQTSLPLDRLHVPDSRVGLLTDALSMLTGWTESKRDLVQ